MIDVKQAVAKAYEYANEILGESDLLLEEIHSTDDRFLVTLSLPKRVSARLLVNPLIRATDREYKTFDIDKTNGDFVGMTIREIA